MKRNFYIIAFTLIIQTVAFPQFQWQWQNSKPTSNNLNEIVALSSTKILAFGGAGNELISTDAGETWSTQQGYTYNLYSICFPDPNTGYASGDQILQKTIDGGNTWNVISFGTYDYLYSLWFISPDIGFVIGDSDFDTYKILKTTNGGIN